MTMDLESRRLYYNRCKPYEPLPPTDERNFDIDAETRGARGVSLVDLLASEMELSFEPVCEFFTGLRGSGKSTELLRLAARLREEKGAHLLPVIIDAAEVLDLAVPIDTTDILVVVLYSVERAVLEAEGEDPEKALEDGPFARLAHWLLHTDVEIPLQAGGKLPGGAAAKSVIGLKTDEDVRHRIRQRVTQHMATFLRQVHGEIEDLAVRAKKQGYSGIVTIVDSLEKLRGISSNWAEVLASGERIFSNGAPQLRLPIHMIYAIPPTLLLRANMSTDRFIPSLKIKDRNGKPSEVGLEAARALVSRRVPDDILKDIFDSDFEQSVTQIIDWSGGCLRDIVRILQRCIARAPITATALSGVLMSAGDSYRRIVTEDSYPFLVQVAHGNQLSFREGNREVVESMFANDLGLRYKDDSEWFDVHPALRDWSRFQKAVAALQQQSSED
jgi:hypothetical protein